MTKNHKLSIYVSNECCWIDFSSRTAIVWYSWNVSNRRYRSNNVIFIDVMGDAEIAFLRVV